MSKVFCKYENVPDVKTKNYKKFKLNSLNENRLDFD